MGAYDSESDEELGDYIETNVLLGYASKEAGDGNEIISKIGGTPDFFSPSSPPPSHTLFKCTSCAGPTVQLLQLNAELPLRFPAHERRLWITICPSKKCRRKEGCVRAVRGVRVDPTYLEEEKKRKAEEEKKRQKEAERKKKEEEEEEEKKTKSTRGAGMGEFLFGGKAGFGKDSSGATNPLAPRLSSTPKAQDVIQDKTTPKAELPSISLDSKLSQSFSSALQLNRPPSPHPPPAELEPWPQAESLPPPFPTLYLSEADYETLDPEAPSPPPQNYALDTDTDAPAGPSTGSGKDKEAPDSNLDTPFQKFADRLSQNPEQVIRYEFGGLPLLYSKSDAAGVALSKPSRPSGDLQMLSGVPRCGNCGGSRTFEVQLTPRAIAELEGDNLSLDGMDWGTIVLAVCERDCLPRGVEAKEAEDQVEYLSEWVGVQWEELGK
ncbi:PDCD2 C domain-containing protein [Zalerion maritima]|uniref:PDCD2 C domain-containing protein n=1 Tax=Zalerion maritima TaxID=339359 RepID=A0AAD5RNG0_9PEZI|nr:PDCD2 C domain-containing protein [Zalerion maritima]